MTRALACLFLLVLLGPSAAFAQGADEATQPAPAPSIAIATPAGAEPTAAQRALDLGREGLRAYGEFDFETALERFSRAEELFHSPVFQLYRARCLRGLGRPTEARALLLRITTEEMSDSAPDAWRRAQSEAREDLVALEAALARSEPPNAASGDLPDDFDADGIVRRTAVAMPKPRPEEPRPTSSFWSRRTASEKAAVVAFGVGTVGLVFSAVTGGLALAQAAKVRENCIGTSCRPEDLPLAEEARQLANLATVGGAVALAGGATGAVLWLLPTGPAGQGLAVAVVGPSLRVTGRF